MNDVSQVILFDSWYYTKLLLPQYSCLGNPMDRGDTQEQYKGTRP